MANFEHKKELDGFTLVQRKNMSRGKPHQQLYRPGSGPLRKSNNFLEDSESDTNLVITSRHNQSKNNANTLEYKSEGNSPRDKKSADLSNMTSRLEDLSFNPDKDGTKRNRKREQELYVPRPVAQSRASTSSQDSNRNTYGQSNGQEQRERFGNNRGRNYSDRTQDRRQEGGQKEWIDTSSGYSRDRQGSEPRANNDSGSTWHGSRDTKSVEPMGPPGKTFRNEKTQSKPPTGRRFSSVGFERNYKHPNLQNLPPRFQKQILEQSGMHLANPAEDNWDGTTITFQAHNNNNFGGIKNPSFHQVGPNFSPATGAQTFHNQNLGYHTLPNKSRGRGRLMQDFELGHRPTYRSITPEHSRSPTNSRPPTPPMSTNRKNNSRPQTPVNANSEPRDDRGYSSWNSRSIPEERPAEVDGNRRNNNDHRRGFGDARRDFNRDSSYNSNRGNRREDPPRDRMTPNREFHRERDTTYKDKRGRETPNRRDSETPNRRGPAERSFGDRKRNTRRERDRRSSSREYNRNIGHSDNRNSKHDDNSSFGNDYRTTYNGEVDEFKAGPQLRSSLEAQLSPVSPESPQNIVQPITQIINKSLDWSEEVELNCMLEQENLSDALTRSSSITSLMENMELNTVSLPPNTNTTPSPGKRSKRRNRRNSRNRSDIRDGSHSRTRQTRQNSTTSIDSHDSFKVPQTFHSRGRHSRDRRESSHERYYGGSRNQSRDCSWDRQPAASGNWRDDIIRSRQNSERDNKSDAEDIRSIDTSTKKAGVIVLPQQKSEPHPQPSPNTADHPRYPEARRSPGQLQKSLFDPNNPNKPIIVNSSSTRIAVPGFSDNAETTPPQMYTTDQFGNLRPSWYDETTEEFRSCHYPDLLRDVKRADTELQIILNTGQLLVSWGVVDQLRQFLKEALEYLLSKAIKFCQSENVEQHFWKILYHNIIETTRKAIKADPENKEKYKGFLLYLIDEGTKYFEKLLGALEETYDFKLSNFLGDNNRHSHKGMGLLGLALISAQKLFLFLGDLGRYREEVNESSNYGKCRQWYIKSHEINPKNGKPYNQLALLAVYARRKLDAVYYYMRSLMSSNPVPSARESLISLFDENRKKYEQGERKRREERLERRRQQMKQKESEEPVSAAGSLRKETWIRPDGGRRVHRTTQANPDQNSDEEDLAALSSVEVNKRFVISYLHVHGKLITKIGMETFQESALQMLREFRALMQHSPVPVPCNRFLQLLALNMFAIDSTQLRDPQLQSQPGYRSELQERALVVSLQMFDLILERCVAVLREHLDRRDAEAIAASSSPTSGPSAAAATPSEQLPLDADVLLPAVKVWCDWMLGHAKVWNPPPSTRDFNVGPPGDAWSRLAALMNLIERLDHSTSNQFVKEQREGYQPVRLPEDSVLAGFEPLMFSAGDASFVPSSVDMEKARSDLRLSRLLFFGTEYLCGVDPPVLRLEIADEAGNREYVSAVDSTVQHGSGSGGEDTPPTPGELARNNDVLLESFSEDEAVADKGIDSNITSNAPTEILDLLTRKVELEKTQRSRELHMRRVKKILSQSVVSVHIEVRPKHLVPDTNCFIDHLNAIRTIEQSHCYTLMVPTVVLSELEGLSRGGKTPTPLSRRALSAEHLRKVAESAKAALEFLRTRHYSVKCVTTKGAILPSTTFSTEDDTSWDNDSRNDDKILTTCLVLCKGQQSQDTTEGEPRHLIREVVLLTEDRNLRVKAYARDVPVRELPDFMRWAGLG